MSHPSCVGSAQLATIGGGFGPAPGYDAHPDQAGRNQQHQDVRPA
jgi:hypothetical protein